MGEAKVSYNIDLSVQNRQSLQYTTVNAGLRANSAAQHGVFVTAQTKLCNPIQSIVFRFSMQHHIHKKFPE